MTAGCARTTRAIATLCAGVALTASAGAFARGPDRRTEAAAHEALKKAEADYLASAFVKGLARLQKASRACSTTRCKPRTRASLVRDIGVMQFRGGDATAARASFAEARRIDPTVEPNPSYDAPEVRAAWDGTDLAKPAPSSTPQATPPPASGPPPETTAAPEASHGAAPAEASEKADDTASARPHAYAHFWVGVTGSMDLLALPGASNVCALDGNGRPANGSGYYCTRPDGSDYPSRGASGALGTQQGDVGGGITTGALRVALSADYALSSRALVGVRLGYAFPVYPGAAAGSDGVSLAPHIHAELRGTYLFGDEPLANSGFAPMVFVGGGLSESSASIRVMVAEQGVPGRRSADAWLLRGPWFLAVGGGGRYAFSPRVAFTGGVGLQSSFGSAGFQLSAEPEVGLNYGF